MATQSIGIERLETLANHLENGQLGHRVFDFSTYNSADVAKCGTAGCAIGECPIVFTQEWKWNDLGLPQLRYSGGSNGINVQDNAEAFFDLTPGEYLHLFYPGAQVPSVYGGRFLGVRATRYEVAANIRAFISKTEKP